MEREGDGAVVLRLTRASSEQVAAWEAEQRRKRIATINEAAGASCRGRLLLLGSACGGRGVYAWGTLGTGMGRAGQGRGRRRAARSGAGRVAERRGGRCQQCKARAATLPTPPQCPPAGFAAVFEAMRECGKPAVGHNLAFDLAYSLHSYAEASAGAAALS